MTTYNKTFYTSPAGLWFAKIYTETGDYHIFWKAGKYEVPVFSYDVEKNRFKYIGGVSQISPEALKDLADFGAGIYDNNN